MPTTMPATLSATMPVPMSVTMPATWLITMCNNISDKNKKKMKKGRCTKNLRVNVQESKGKCTRI